MGEQILFSLTPITGAIGNGKAYQAQVTPNETKNVSAMASDLADTKHTTVADEVRELSYLHDYMLTELGQGNALAFGGFTLSPTILGSFDTVDAAFEGGRHDLVVVGRTFGEVRAAARGLEPVNVNAPLKATLYSVMDAHTKELDLVTFGICYLQGRGLTVNTSRADEGVWLVGPLVSSSVGPLVGWSVGQDQETKRPEDQKTMYRATVNTSDSQTVNCTFETLPPEGAYTLRLVTRGGGRADFAPVTLERRVTVKHIRPVPVKLESVLLTFSDGSTKVLTPEEAEALRRQQP